MKVPGDGDWLEILRHNVGFEDPDRWVGIARAHSFQRVRATPIERCPDCAGKPGRPLGQFVYYSTLVRLRPCEGCGLLFADVRIDPALLRNHFEKSYKGERYFAEMRSAIFESVASEVASRAKAGASVLDVGGAEGHLLHRIRELRPDLRLRLADVSAAACRAARDHGFQAEQASLAELGRRHEHFDVVLLIDVAYYEQDIRATWEAVDRLVAKPGGLLVLRAPNKLAWIRLVASIDGLLGRARSRPQSTLRLFNPEHAFLLTRSYLTRRLAGLGFGSVDFDPSPMLLRRRWMGPALKGAYRIGRAASALPGHPVLTPSFLMLAERRA